MPVICFEGRGKHPSNRPRLYLPLTARPAGIRVALRAGGGHRAGHQTSVERDIAAGADRVPAQRSIGTPPPLHSGPGSLLADLHLHRAAAVVLKTHDLVSECQRPACSRQFTHVVAWRPGLIAMAAFHRNGRGGLRLDRTLQGGHGHHQHGGRCKNCVAGASHTLLRSSL